MEIFFKIAIFKRKVAAARHGIQFLVLEVIRNHSDRRQKRSEQRQRRIGGLVVLTPFRPNRRRKSPLQQIHVHLRHDFFPVTCASNWVAANANKNIQSITNFVPPKPSGIRTGDHRHEKHDFYLCATQTRQIQTAVYVTK